MGILAPPPPPTSSLLSYSNSNHNRHQTHLIFSKKTWDNFSINSMSQDFHQGIFSFSNGFNRSTAMHQDQQSMGQHRQPSLVGIEEEVDSGELPVYESGGVAMLSEMFSYQSGTAPPTDMLENHFTENYRLRQPLTSEWHGNRLGMVGGLRALGETKQHHSSNNRDSTSTIAQHHHHLMPSMNADSATAMQLFHMNPQQRSPSPTSTTPSSSTPLHLLLPNTSTTPHPSLQGFHSPRPTDQATFGSSPIPQSEFTWVTGSGGGENTSTQQLYVTNNRTGGTMEGHQVQGLSLSLSSLQHLEAVKAEEMRMGDGSVVYYNPGSSSSSSYQQPLHLQGIPQNQNHQVHFGYSTSFGVIHLLRHSKYTKPAEQLLEEFCSVGRGNIRNNMRAGRHNKNLTNTNQSSSCGGGGGGGESSSLSKNLPPLSTADKIEYQRKKATLLSMLDEVDRRYNHYCEQMQMVVNSFDTVMGYGSATPYTVLAQKAMSRHFRCLKDAIVGQLKIVRELVGEKGGVGSSGITKGETPRLKLVDQSLRQQRAFQQMGIMEQEAWRPQRGLPERSVTILRAWLFEHFLHPYPSDPDKHWLARQTGLSRNQVSNWFINARVRLWKPMVEEMYQQESKIVEENEEERESSKSNCSAQTPTPSTTATTPTATPTATVQPTRTCTGTGTGRGSEIIDAFENDSSLNAINRQCFSESQANQTTTTLYNDMSPANAMPHRYNQMTVDHTPRGGSIVVDYGTTGEDNGENDSKFIRFGGTVGELSLTLGLQHTGNLPENNQFSVNDYGSC